MSRRMERVARLIQETVGQIILRDMADPRIDPARISITRVEVADDFTHAKVYFSAMGTEAEQRTAQRGLQHAAGRIQERMMAQIQLRATPVLAFVPDVQFKKSLTTLNLISQAMRELRQREQPAGGIDETPIPEAGEGEEEPLDADEETDEPDEADEA